MHAIINVDFMSTETTISDITMIISSPDALEQSLPKQKCKPMEDPVKHEHRSVHRKPRNDNKLEDITPSKKLGNNYTDLKPTINFVY